MNSKFIQRLVATALLLLTTICMSWACPVCERNQPKVLKGVIHGSGPDSQWDYVIIWAFVFIALATLYYSVKWLIKPGETNKDHIKYSILNDDPS